jgi:hypothetical protein
MRAQRRAEARVRHVQRATPLSRFVTIFSRRYDKLFEIFKSSQGGSATAASSKRPKSAGGEKKISAEQAKILVDTNEHYVGFYRSRLQVQ